MSRHLPVALLVFSAFASGQTTLTSGTIVTGQCNGHASDPGCVIPDLFGPQGITLANAPQFSHFAHFIGSSQQILNQSLSSSIATQLTLLPIISPASGFTYGYDRASGAFVRSTTSFGPIYSERAETIGRHKFSIGTSYQRFRFNSLDGINLRNIPAVFSHISGTGPNGTDEPYEADVIATKNSLALNMDQTVVYGSIGLTDHLDLSVAVPIVSVRFGAESDARIIQVAGVADTVTTAAGTSAILDPHTFTNGLNNTYLSNPVGRATGIGDVTFRLKQSVFRGELFQVAAAVDVRLPTGSAQKLLGSGAAGVKPFVIISSNRRFSPHVNLGYEWNGSSILAGNITGTTITEQADTVLIQTGNATKGSLPGALIYSVGADWGATKKLTLSVDYLGQTVINAPRVFLTQFHTANDSGNCTVFQGSTYCGLASQSLPDISGGKQTITLNNGAVGLKYNLFNQLLLTADLLFRMDNQGLRQDVTPLVAVSYSLGK